MSIKVRFLCERDGKEVVVDAEPGERLTQPAHRGQVVIQQTCAGKAACTDCKIIVKDGIETGFEPAVGAELRQLGNVYFITHERLACQALVKGDSTVFVPLVDRSNRKNKNRIKESDRGNQEEKKGFQSKKSR
ncbi:MAG: 2Fe-2S iron-sulfur cluster binding domain-containing protein [Bdellovibrionales bacterium]|nr:2Fe-2S iron-sulfur cluster binding domain-containing protein [Bdellovibrionales bacterium]